MNPFSPYEADDFRKRCKQEGVDFDVLQQNLQRLEELNDEVHYTEVFKTFVSEHSHLRFPLRSAFNVIRKDLLKKEGAALIEKIQSLGPAQLIGPLKKYLALCESQRIPCEEPTCEDCQRRAGMKQVAVSAKNFAAGIYAAINDVPVARKQ